MVKSSPGIFTSSIIAVFKIMGTATIPLLFGAVVAAKLQTTTTTTTTTTTATTTAPAPLATNGVVLAVPASVKPLPCR
jgi:hypothetical protein